MFKFSKDYIWKPVCNWYQFLSLRHFKKRLLKLFADIAAFPSHGRLFQMAAPEYINDLKKDIKEFTVWFRDVELYRSRGSSIFAVKF